MNKEIEILPARSGRHPRCVVCTKALSPGEKHFTVSHAGNEYRVCCASCDEKFRRNPALYAVS